MKKLFPNSFAIIIAVMIWLVPALGKSQTVINQPLFASFEDGTTDPFDRFLDTMNGTFQIENNTEKTGINTSDKCLKFTCTSGGAGWWGKLFMRTNSAYTIQQNTTSHRYLHFFAYTTNATKTAELQIKDVSGNVVLKPQYTLSEANVWEEVVVDLGSSFSGTIGEIYVAPCLDWGGGLSTGDVYMLDQFTLSDIAGTYYDNPILSTFENGFTSPFTYTIDGGTLNTEYDNPVTTTINNSAKCMYSNFAGGTDWWYKTRIETKSTYRVEPISANHKYLHFFSRRDYLAESELQVKDDADNLIYQKRFSNMTTNTWEEIVLDLTASDNSLPGVAGKKIGKIWLVNNVAWTAAAQQYQYDQFVLSDSKDPIGLVRTPSNIGDFENDLSQYIMALGTQTSGATAIVAANPLASDPLNETTKVLKYDRPAGAETWHSLRLYTDGFIGVAAPNMYLHFMMYNPAGQNVTAIIENVAGEVFSQAVTPLQTTAWADYVIDLSSYSSPSLNNIRTINLRMSEDVNANTYYFDEFLINDVATARTAGPSTGLKSTEDKTSVYTSGENVHVVGKNIAAVELYNMNGVMIHRTDAAEQLVLSLNKGVSLLKVYMKDGNSSVYKVVL